jgi:endonuclease/exonuclease/phosphatase family metal-dependent hydrolase
MTETLHIATFNIHKGFSNFNRRLVVHELRDRLRSLRADLIFLQEVQGAHQGHGRRHPDWPGAPQHEFLADSVWSDFAYGKNAVYRQGHHGNAILSRFPIVAWENQDISSHGLESRGLLHCKVRVPEWDQFLHAICVHLGLFSPGRMHQLLALCGRIERLVPADAPLVIAGDFNDWRLRASTILRSRLGLREVFELTRGRPARSFPSGLPILRLDRIYVRGLQVRTAQSLHGRHWAKLSDHAPLYANLVRPLSLQPWQGLSQAML